MTQRERIKRQKDFIARCIDSSQTLDEILSDLELPADTLAGWLMDRDFRIRLHRLRKYLKKARELQVDLGAVHAASCLSRVATDTRPADAKPVQRAACVDLIRLSRDCDARRKMQTLSADDLTKRHDLYHPAIAADEAQALMDELDRRETAPKTP